MLGSFAMNGPLAAPAAPARAALTAPNTGAPHAAAPDTSTPGDLAAAAGRIAWLDVARGLGIVLVVAGHALGGLIDSPLGGALGGFRQAFFAIYTFHMPLFFVLAGLMVEPRLARGPGMFVRRLLPSLVWPYVLWSVVQFSTIALLGSLVNRPAGPWWHTVLALPWRPVSQFWFLHALFCLHCLVAVLLPRVGREGLLLLGLLARPLAFAVPLDPVLRLILANAQWYALGVWLGTAGLEQLMARCPVWVRAGVLPSGAAVLVGLGLQAALAAGAPALATASSPQIANLAWRLPLGAAALAGTLAVIGLATWRPLTAGGLLAALGRSTMPVYLLHVLFVAGGRIVLIRCGLTDPVALLPVLVAAGLAGPLLLARLARAAGLHRLLGFG